MILHKLRRLHRAKPFRPFTIHLADGRELDVMHPELLALNAGDNTAVLLWPATDLQIIELSLVTRVRRSGARAK